MANPIIYPPSIQTDLFGYLNHEQQKAIRPILRLLKNHVQQELCTSLVDYLETGNLDEPANPLLKHFCLHIIDTIIHNPKR